MAVIDVSTEDPGVVRIFFDLQPADPSREEQRRIASAIERAMADATQASDPELRLN